MLSLEDKAMKDDILIGDTPKAQRRRRRLKGVRSAGKIWKHSTLKDIHGLLTLAEIEQFFTFTLVRNPWDRVVSYYHWLVAQEFQHAAVSLAKSTSFSEFLNHPTTMASLSRSGYLSYVIDPNGVDRCSMFLRLETLSAQIPALEARLGYRLPNLAHVNKSKRVVDWRRYYSDADAALVAQICAPDINTFSYRFEG